MRKSSRSKPPENTPPPWQSRLEPFLADIWKWRRSGKTYRQIAALLQDEKAVTATHTCVYKFIEARKRRFAELNLPALPGEPVEAAPAALPVPATSPVPDRPPSRSVAPVTRQAARQGSDAQGFPLTKSQEVIGSDALGRAITRNKPFKGEV